MIVPIIHHEKQVQLADLSRFDASKSIAVKGSAELTSLKIRPGVSEGEIEVFVANKPKEWFLDYAYNEMKFDVDSSNSMVFFKYVGSTLNTNLASGSYTLTGLVTEINIKIGALVPSLGLSFAIDNNRVLITSSSPLEFIASRSPFFDVLGLTMSGVKGLLVEYGMRKITLTASDGVDARPIDAWVKTFTEEGDGLYSIDDDLVAFEPDIMKWLPAGKSSYKNYHRKAQTLMLDWMDRQGYRDRRDHKFGKNAFVDNSDVRVWSTYMVLKLIFMGIRNTTDDVFKKKASEYEKEEISARNRAVLNLDLDGDGKAEAFTPGPDAWSGSLRFS